MDVVGGVAGVVGDLLMVCAGGSSPACWTWSPLTNSSQWEMGSAQYSQLTYPSGISVSGQLWVTGGMMSLDQDPDPQINLLSASDPDEGNPYEGMNMTKRGGRSSVDTRSTSLYRYCFNSLDKWTGFSV